MMNWGFLASLFKEAKANICCFFLLSSSRKYII